MDKKERLLSTEKLDLDIKTERVCDFRIQLLQLVWKGSQITGKYEEWLPLLRQRALERGPQKGKGN